MGRPTLASDDDQLERVVHKRNIVCSGRLLGALRLNHSEPSDLDQGEPTPEPEEECDPEPQVAIPELTTVAIVPDPPPVFISQNKVEQIKRIVCKRFGISKSDIESQCRRGKFSNPRQIAMHLARKHTTHSYPEIGRRFGGRDHTTIIHAFNKIGRLATSDAHLAAQLAELGAKIPA